MCMKDCKKILDFFIKKYSPELKLFFTYCFVALSFFSCTQDQKPYLPSLNETFRKDDKKPFGSYVAYNHFKKLFNNNYVEITEKSFEDTWDNIKDYSTDKYSLYVLIAKNLSVIYNEADAMASFVKEGNDLFIAADYIDMELQAKVDFLTEREEEINKEMNGVMHPASVKMFFGHDFKAKQYGYYYYPFLNYFSGYDSGYTRVLGVNEAGRPNYIVMFIGKGRLYLHAAPRVFSNYFLLTNNNYEYLENVLSYLRSEPKNIYWDEYYKNKSYLQKRSGSSGNGDNEQDKKTFSSFDVINKHPALLWAFWISLISILLFVLFNMKRKQRVINEVKPNINTTVTFTETVGRLYLEKKNNKNIADKMITYFYEHIRNKYFLNTSQVNQQFITALSGKSGFGIEETGNLFNSINNIHTKENIEDSELMTLNEQLQKFYKNKT